MIVSVKYRGGRRVKPSVDLSPCGNDQRFFIFRGVAIRIMKVSVKNITNVRTKHGFVATVFKPAPTILADFSSYGVATAMNVA